MRTLAALLMLVCAIPANADWRTDVQAAQFVGEGDFSVFGFRLYRTQLWSEHVPVNYREPFALHLIYTRSISGERFADTGINEIKRQAVAPIPQETGSGSTRRHERRSCAWNYWAPRSRSSGCSARNGSTWPSAHV